MKQGGVTLDGEKVTDIHAEVSVDADAERELKVGKRTFVRLTGIIL
jgi:Tyrosyl-tRNA synthetase